MKIRTVKTNHQAKSGDCFFIEFVKTDFRILKKYI